MIRSMTEMKTQMRATAVLNWCDKQILTNACLHSYKRSHNSRNRFYFNSQFPPKKTMKILLVIKRDKRQSVCS
jgi:hypothetical protein